MNTQFFLIVLAILLIAVSVYFGLKVLSIYQRKKASAGWPAVTGNVLSKQISTSRSSNSTSYRAEVTYGYATPSGQVEKKLFLGSKGLRDQAQKLLDAVGETIQVRYNPEKPTEHISDHEKIMPAQVAAIIGSLVLAILLIVLAL